MVCVRKLEEKKRKSERPNGELARTRLFHKIRDSHPLLVVAEPSSLSIEYITVATRMSSCIGILREYALGDDWEDYTDRVRQYFMANKMDAEREDYTDRVRQYFMANKMDAEKEEYTDRLRQYFVENKMDTDEDAEKW